ncbi:hypothetical protein [Pseudomonas sp. JL3]|uniref:hypothetical protein n=1 Tax=Pseudomonas sp. JL3 TaxID=2919943 RepID=UPI00218A0031|nr:hypothetical protein [Pseudomonas sp. JL3]MDR8364208.1 hypothetical protein [Pseudomonas sp. JL3]URM27151.1 hypothetical protein LLY42_25440 [Pseudomonas frederiksbergensis]
MLNFDCVKVAGKVDYVKVSSDHGDSYKAIVSIDGQVLPNLTLPKKMYEEIDAGETVTLYGFFKNSSNKEKNTGIVYGLLKENGAKTFATSIRFTVPLLMVFYAVLAFCIVFPVGWLVSIVPMMTFIGGQHPMIMEYTSIVALVEAALAALFFLWAGWNVLNKTSDPEGWRAVAAQELSNRFSKLHK